MSPLKTVKFIHRLQEIAPFDPSNSKFSPGEHAPGPPTRMCLQQAACNIPSPITFWRLDTVGHSNPTTLNSGGSAPHSGRPSVKTETSHFLPGSQCEHITDSVVDLGTSVYPLLNYMNAIIRCVYGLIMGADQFRVCFWAAYYMVSCTYFHLLFKFSR